MLETEINAKSMSIRRKAVNQLLLFSLLEDINKKHVLKKSNF